tara:strand:+ start:7473 stop:7922 length:450 start_codon:yes stop_codon:yes gene_type:complete
MSAWLCSAEHIGQLAIKYSEVCYPKVEATEVATKMAMANLNSLKYRYSHDWKEYFLSHYGDDGAYKYVNACIEAAKSEPDPDLTWIELYSMMQCYAYQSCEDQKSWEKKINKRLFVQEEALLFYHELVCEGMKEELREAPWGYYGRKAA